MNFNVLLQDKVNEVDDIVKSFLPEEKGYQQTVLKAMNYSVLAGGKRLRPLLMQEVFKLFSGSGEVVRPFMAAMEMIHT